MKEENSEIKNRKEHNEKVDKKRKERGEMKQRQKTLHKEECLFHLP